MTGSSLVAATSEIQDVLHSLENAAALFTSPDPVGRSQGEATFLQLRQSPNAVEYSLFALEHSSDAFVHFQCLSVLLEHLPSLSLNSSSANLPSLTVLRDFLYALILSRCGGGGKVGNDNYPQWPNWTRSRALQAFSAVELRLLGLELEEARKSRQTVTILEAHTQFILSNILQLTLVQNFNNDQTTFFLGTGLANALLEEIALINQVHANNKSDDQKQTKGKSRLIDHSGLSPIQQRWTKVWVQERILPHILQIIVDGFSFILSGQASADQSSIVPLLAAFVNLSEKILRWSAIFKEPWAGLDGELSYENTVALLHDDSLFLEDDLGDLESEEQPALSSNGSNVRYVPESLASSLMSTEMISLIASSYRFANQLDTVSNREAALCLSKLRRGLLAIASFAQAPQSGVQLATETRQVAILETLKALQEDLQHTGSPLLTDRGQALLFLAQMYTVTLKSNTSRSTNIAQYCIDNVFGELSAFSSVVLSFSFDRREITDEEEDLNLLADEMVPSLLSAWLAISELVNDCHIPGKLSSYAFAGIVKPYLDARLRQASMSANGEDDEDDDDEYGEETRPDQERYEDSLIMLATLARHENLRESLAYIQSISDNLLHELKAFYQVSKSISFGSTEMKALEHRWESIHWIMLIAGHMIADVSKGEVAMVPREIEILPEQDQQITIHLIRSLGLELAQLLASADGSLPQSPQVMQTLLWFNARWIPGYLLIRSTPVLSAQFDDQAGIQILTFLLTNCRATMGAWLGDSDVILQIASVLRAFALSEGVMRTLLSMVEFELLNKAIIEGLGGLPAKTHKPLISALIGCIYASSAEQSPELFFNRITHAIEERLSVIVHQPSFTSTSVYQRGDVIESLLNALDMFDGLAASTQPKSARAVFSFLSRFFDTLVNLTQMYKSRNEVCTGIIRIFRTLIGALDLGFGVDDEIVANLNDVIWRLLEGLNAAILIGDSPSMALEDDVPFESLCLTLELLNDLSLASDGDSRSNVSDWMANVSHRQTGDVCLFGFSRLVPHLQGDVLSSPGVRIRLERLTSRLFLTFGHRLSGIVIQESIHKHGAGQGSSGVDGECAQLYSACVQALALSLTFDETNAVIDGVEAVDNLAKSTQRVLREAFHATNGSVGQEFVNSAGQLIIGSLLNPLLDTLLRSTLIEPIAPSMLEIHIHTLFTLFKVIIDTPVRWISNEGQQNNGSAHLQTHLQEFCSSTSLSSNRSMLSSITKRVNIATNSVSTDEMRRREVLKNVSIQLIELCMTTNGNDDRAIESKAREIAWQARSNIKIH